MGQHDVEQGRQLMFTNSRMGHSLHACGCPHLPPKAGPIRSHLSYTCFGPRPWSVPSRYSLEWSSNTQGWLNTIPVAEMVPVTGQLRGQPGSLVGSHFWRCTVHSELGWHSSGTPWLLKSKDSSLGMAPRAHGTQVVPSGAQRVGFLIPALNSIFLSSGIDVC